MGGSGNYDYSWEPVTGLSDPTIPNPIATPEVTTVYTITVDDGDAIVTDEVTITVNPVPETPTITQTGNMLVSSAVAGNQWYDSNGMILGATSQTYEPGATDDYYVIVTNEYGCESDPSDSYHFIYTGLIELSGDQKINIYPNPFFGQFTLDYSLKSASDVTITIFNTFGQQMTLIENLTFKSAGNHRIQFDASRFDTGVYFLKVETSEYSVIKRLVHTK
jgi:hypothetical protein